MQRVTDSPVSLITGGGSGIGAATARQLLNLGHRVTITGRGEARLRGFAKELGEPASLMTLAGDAADWDAVRSAVETTITEFGRLDNVVANAGIANFDRLDDGDPAGWRDMVLTNVLGPTLLIRAALSALKQTRGRIVLVGSVAGVIHAAKAGVYGATKWAVTGLAENTRLMVTGDGVGVTLINPGGTDTNILGGPPPNVPMITADQCANSIVWAINQPNGVDINTVTVRPIGAPH